VFPIDQQQTEA